MHRIGEEVSEQLHIEVKVTVLQNVHFKYACRHCEHHAERTPIVLAPMPAQPRPGSHASPAMIATVTVGKYVDGTPLYRMEDVLARSNIPIGRGTRANWIIRPSELHYSRLYDALHKTLLSQPLIQRDETTLQVLKELGKSAQSKSYMIWCYRSAEDCLEPVVLFDYQPGRGQEYPKAFLDGYKGMLMSDGYSVWRMLKKASPAHVLPRRSNTSRCCIRSKRSPRAKLPDGETRGGYTHRLRQQHSVPLLNGFKAWLDELASKVLPESLLGKAISYSRNQWPYLTGC